MDLILNELSAAVMAGTVEEVLGWLQRFAMTARQAIEVGVEPSLHVQESFWATQLYQGEYIAASIARLQKEENGYLLTIIARGRVIEHLLVEEGADVDTFKTRDALGLSLGLARTHPAISLSVLEFQASPLTLDSLGDVVNWHSPNCVQASRGLIDEVLAAEAAGEDASALEPWVVEDRPASDDETFLAGDGFVGGNRRNQGRRIYRELATGHLYAVDNFHGGSGSHVEHWDALGVHLGTNWPDGRVRGGPEADHDLDLD